MSSLGLLSIKILTELSDIGVDKSGFEVCIWQVIHFPGHIIPLKIVMERRPKNEFDLILKVKG